MPELTTDGSLTLRPPESSPVSRVITRIKEAIHRHTPEGRREEYRDKWNHVLEGTKGLPRFELEKRLNDEAANTPATAWCGNRIYSFARHCLAKLDFSQANLYLHQSASMLAFPTILTVSSSSTSSTNA